MVDNMILLVSCGGFAVGLVISFVSKHGYCGFFFFFFFFV